MSKQIKISGTELPDYVPREAWDSYMAMRKAKKKPLSEDGFNRAMKNLLRLFMAGEDIAMVLNQSEDRCWTGLFAVGDGYKQEQGVSLTAPAVGSGSVEKRLGELLDRSWADTQH